ncbi:phosphatidylinositol-specific phospholipase C domain-containing protein [Amycolatopsis halotolerans]|uniref:Phosphatidylinositol-specific phospholipase C domain-containing protein n=1 Tax=Amycolatopsis halotolerans TaxID=330083 RepID=A0ABV7QG65_9PSEU
MRLRRTAAAIAAGMLASLLAPAPFAGAGERDLKLSEATTAGVHNTYATGTYRYLAESLDSGTTLIELDIWAKPFGNGWWVNHLSPIGNANNCVAADTPDGLYHGTRNQDFAHCLDDIKLWLDAHPNYGPLHLKIENKSGFAAGRGQGPAGLDAMLRLHLGDRIYRPAELLAGHRTLDEAARANAWPVRSALRGKIVVELIPGVNERLNPLDPVKSDVEYASYLRTLRETGRIDQAQIFPVVLDAQPGDPRRRYTDPGLRPWFVVFDGFAVDYVNGSIDTSWYDTNHYLLIMTKAHEPKPSIDSHHPDTTEARERVARLARAHATVATSDWSYLHAALSPVYPRG